MVHRILFTIPCSMLLLAAPAGSPQGAFANLYQVAEAMTNLPNGPGLYFEKDESPQFPYPDEVQKGWLASVASAGDQFSGDLKTTLVDCAALLNHAISLTESGYIIEITQPAGQQDAASLYSQAKELVNQCSAANALATGALAPPPQNQQSSASQSATVQPNAPAQTLVAGYGELLPAMQGQTDINGETFRLTTAAGKRVGYAFEGPVQGTFGTTAFSKAPGTFQSRTEVLINAMWDKSGNPIDIGSPITIGMKPQ